MLAILDEKKATQASMMPKPNLNLNVKEPNIIMFIFPTG